MGASGLEPVGGASSPRRGVGDRPAVTSVLSPGRLSQALGPGPLGLKREMKAAMPEGVGASGLTLRSS